MLHTGGVHFRQKPTQIPIGLLASVSVSASAIVNTPQGKTFIEDFKKQSWKSLVKNLLSV